MLAQHQLVPLRATERKRKKMMKKRLTREGEWDYEDGERDVVGKATPEPASPAPASPQGEGEGGGEALVTQRDEEIENYQSTVKELTAAVTEDRCASIRIHRPFQLFPGVCIVYYSFFLSSLKHL